MTFNYPLTFNNEDELIKYVRNNSNFYERILDKDR